MATRLGSTTWRRALRAALAGLALATAAIEPGAGSGPRIPRARAEEAWFVEFESICARTQDAMSLTSDELRVLVSRCDRLKPQIEGLDPSRRKVYVKRLQQCRDLYQFVLDTRGQG
jgi:hypothetical protein